MAVRSASSSASRRRGDVDGDRDVVTPRELARLPFERGTEPEIVEHRGAQAHGDVADRLHGVLERAAQLVEPRLELVARPAVDAAEVLDLHAQAGEHLPDLVVQLA